jgi:hypothetical protein
MKEDSRRSHGSVHSSYKMSWHKLTGSMMVSNNTKYQSAQKGEMMLRRMHSTEPSVWRMRRIWRWAEPRRWGMA